MNPNFHSPLTPFPLEDQQHHHQLFLLNNSQASSSSPAPCSSFLEPAQEQQAAGGYYQNDSYHLHNQDEAEIFSSQGGSWDHRPAPVMNEMSDSTGGLKFSIWKKEERNDNQGENTSTVKWMSSKMRLMKKMMNSDGADNMPNNSMQKFEDQKQPSSPLDRDNSCNNTNTIRVCADCNTTKTPLWRSGPRGPKSLCNACGIRQRKARRAMAAAAAANGTILAADTTISKKSKVHPKDKSSTTSNSNLPFKKRCKFASPSRGKKKLCFEDLTIILSKNSAFQRVFPQDEKEAAILLMALSYGLVQG